VKPVFIEASLAWVFASVAFVAALGYARWRINAPEPVTACNQSGHLDCSCCDDPVVIRPYW